MIIIDPNPALYTTPLRAIISSFDINHHLYADDTQISMFLSVSSAKESLEKLQHFVGLHYRVQAEA